MIQLELDFTPDVFDHERLPLQPTLLIRSNLQSLEETQDSTYGYHYNSDASVYSYTSWFYDNDESAFSVI
jgi:hypothetical protein